MAESIETPTKIKMSDFELRTYGEMYNQGAMIPMVVPPRRAEDGTPLDGEGEDGHNYGVPLSDLDGRIRMYADAAIEGSFDAIVSGAATAAEAQITNEVIRLVHVSMDEYIPGIEETVMAQFPTKVSELENDAGYATTGAMNTALAHKQDIIQDLAEIRSGAVEGSTAVQPRDLATVASSGNYSDLSGKPSIPTKTSDLSNDSGFITAADVPVKDVTVNGSSAVNAQGIATITVPTATSDLQNDSGFVGTQSAPSANQVLTFNGSAVVWADPQGGGGSDLPPITPADEGKFLKVDSGSAVWGEGDAGDTVTIDLGNYYNYVVWHTGDPVDVSDVYAQIISAAWDGKKVRITSMFETVAVLSGYVDTDSMLFAMMPMMKGRYTKEQFISLLIAQFEANKEMSIQLYGTHVYMEGAAPAVDSTVGLKFRIIPVDRYVDPVYYYIDKGSKGFSVLYEKVLSEGLTLIPWAREFGGVTGYKWVENDPYWGTGYAETYVHQHTDIADLVNKRGKKFKFRGYAKTSTQQDELLHYIAEYRAYYTDISIAGISTSDIQSITLKVEAPYLNKNTSPNKYVENDTDSDWEEYVGDAVACTLSMTYVQDLEYDGFVLDTETAKDVGVPVPEVLPGDEGKVLMVVNGVPTWTTLN